MEYNYSSVYKKPGVYTDPLNWDSDNDLMSDGFEFTFRSWNKQFKATLPDPMNGSDADKDLDGDGMHYYVGKGKYYDCHSNLEEFQWGSDSNGDGIIDFNATNPNDPDSDDDGDLDYHEFWLADHDGDGLYTGWEMLFNGTEIFAPDGYKPQFSGGMVKGMFDPYNNDTDNDNILDGEEDPDGDEFINIVEQGDVRSYDKSSDPLDSHSAPETRTSRCASQGPDDLDSPSVKIGYGNEETVFKGLIKDESERREAIDITLIRIFNYYCMNTF